MVATDRSINNPTLLAFIKTLLDIALLRKGPEHIPCSVLMLLFAVSFWLISRLAMLSMVDRFNESTFILEIFSAFIAITCYAAVIVLSGFRERLMQSISAIIGFSGLLAVFYIAAHSLLEPLIGAYPMLLVIFALIVWSISVKGHIIARATNRHWYVGMAVALMIFVLQSAIEMLMVSES